MMYPKSERKSWTIFWAVMVVALAIIVGAKMAHGVTAEPAQMTSETLQDAPQATQGDVPATEPRFALSRFYPGITVKNILVGGKWTAYWGPWITYRQSSHLAFTGTRLVGFGATANGWEVSAKFSIR